MRRVSFNTHHLIEEVLEHEERWHYAGGKRDLRLDFLRGFAALVMIADHIGGDRTWLLPLTGGNKFFVSAAEAFVFISGAVMGIVYLDVVRRSGILGGISKALHRSMTLYLLTVSLTLGFAAAGSALNLWWQPQIGVRGIPSFVVDVALLRRTLFLTDIPLMYTLLLIAAVLAIPLLAMRKTLLLCAASMAIWGLWQLQPGAANLPWRIEGNVVFFFPAWQLLFIAGLVVGWHRRQLEFWIGHLSRPALFSSLSAVTVAVMFLYVAQLAEVDSLPKQQHHVRPGLRQG